MDQNECELGYRVPEFLSPHSIQSIREAFLNEGVAFIDSCDESKFVKLTKELGEIQKPRNEFRSGSGLSRICLSPSLKGKAYTSKDLFFHTDRSGWDLPPRILASLLQVKSQTGGDSLLVDGRRVLEVIREQDQGLYELVTSPGHSSFKSDEGYFQPRAIFDETKAILRFRFDDGIQLSASMIDRLQVFKKIIYQHAFVVALEPGQGYIIDNHRYMHGRSSFTGSRELLRILANPVPTTTTSTERKIITILFDVDGTLCSAEHLSIDAFFSCLSYVAGREISNANTKVNLHGQTDLRLLHDILRYHHVVDKEIPSIIDKFFQLHPHYLESSLSKGFVSKPCPFVNETLDWLVELRKKCSSNASTCTSAELRTGLVTGNSHRNALLKLRAAGIDASLFDLGISSFGDEHYDRLSLLQQAVSKARNDHGPDTTTTNARKDDIIVVGDTPLDIESAKKSGCSVVAVATGSYDHDTLKSLCPGLTCNALSDAKEYLASKVF